MSTESEKFVYLAHVSNESRFHICSNLSKMHQFLTELHNPEVSELCGYSSFYKKFKADRFFLCTRGSSVIWIRRVVVNDLWSSTYGIV